MAFDKSGEIIDNDIFKCMNSESQFRVLVHGFLDSFASIYLINGKRMLFSVFHA